ncbi:Ldh family oxidoreductase [Salinispira pacifica]|nr:Ldh family oxidoreductase [Salinispira pacifica]
MWKKDGKSGGVSQALNEELDTFDTEFLEVSIEEVRSISTRYLEESGFNRDEAELTTRNLLEAELAEKRSHGIIRLPDLRKLIASGDIRTNTSGLSLVRDGGDALHFDAEYQSGSVALYRSLEVAFARMREQPDRNILVTGIKDMSYASGYIGDYARMAAEEGLLFLSFFNSPPILIPHGSRDPQWGTDPVTFSFPAQGSESSASMVHDSASSVITWGAMMNLKREGKELPPGVALDEEGNETRSPVEGMKGGLLSMGEHKGSGMALMVELMAGALTGSRVGTVVDGGWGGTYILIRPGVFLGDDEKVSAQGSELLTALNESRPRGGYDRVRYPGQQSQERRNSHLKNGSIRLPSILWSDIRNGLRANGQ